MENIIDIFDKNEEKADALQEKYGLNMTMRDLYACETSGSLRYDFRQNS